MKNLIIFLILSLFLSSCEDVMEDVFPSKNEVKAEEAITKISGLMYNPIKNSEKLFALTSPKGTMRAMVLSAQKKWISGDSIAIKFYYFDPEENLNGELWVKGSTSTVRLSKGDTVLVSGPDKFEIKMLLPTVADSIWTKKKSLFGL